MISVIFSTLDGKGFFGNNYSAKDKYTIAKKQMCTC